MASRRTQVITGIVVTGLTIGGLAYNYDNIKNYVFGDSESNEEAKDVKKEPSRPADNGYKSGDMGKLDSLEESGLTQLLRKDLASDSLILFSNSCF